ncbi:AraC-type DNA-binding protein [Pedobacter westerhofensis]|uniref:AraC-type DNA-binding protein n=1 Tax=Pedobacter westerhofensis TaxID=425512 RepID=A0A521F2G9_9SPHI|nr:helix-turn-helix transcriptional regulator [Pedobacter westerhofensis]SMO90398.1 AraC-type DNA-binding protein [Pedobacter westerhofensis]
MFPTYTIEDFASPRAIQGQFMLERFEDLARPKKWQFPHLHSFYEIIWVKEGTSKHTIDYHDFDIQPNSLFFISPGQVHLLSQSENVVGYSIAFTWEFLLMNNFNQDAVLALTFLDDSYANPFLALTQEAIQEIEPVIKLIVEEINRNNKSLVILNHLLFVLLNHIQRLGAVERSDILDSYQVITFKKFKKFIELSYKRETGLSYYAGLLSMSVHHLNEIVKKVTGRTAGEVIRDRALTEAKRLLVHSRFSIGQISEELGFKDFSYFSRQFKSQEGSSPAEYRRQMYQKYQNSTRSY